METDEENDNEKLNAIQTADSRQLYGIYREPNAISQNVINHKKTLLDMK